MEKPDSFFLFSLLFVLFTAFSSLFSIGVAFGDEPSMEDYRADPPFMSVSVKPNILLILDSSGSMNEFAYQEISGCRANSNACNCDVQSWTGYQEDMEYYGIFDPDLCYAYSNTNHYFASVGSVDDDASTTDVQERAAEVPGQWSEGRQCFSGNWLNWLTTRRVDAAKKVLTGGKVASGTTDVLLGTVGPNSTSLDRDLRKVYDDGLATPSTPTKSVYYTPVHQPVYAYFFAEDRGGGQYAVVFNLIQSAPCAVANRVDTTGYMNVAATYGGETAATCPQCNYDGFFVAVLAEEPPKGIVQNVGDTNPGDGEDDSKVRLGYMHFNYSDGGKIYNYVDTAGPSNSHFEDIVDEINGQVPNGWTPTEEVVDEAVRYFKQDTPRYSGDFQVNDTWDPYYFNDTGQTISCTKSFMILITDGEPNYNEDLGSTKNEVFVGDGYFQYSTSDYSYYLDDLAFRMHTQDQRLGDGMDGDQTIALYTVFAFEQNERASQYLMRASRAGGFNDLDSDGQPFCDDGSHCGESDESWAQSFYRGSCGDPIGDEGNCTADSLCKEWDRDCDGVPDTFFEAQNGAELAESLLAAITDILRRSASGTSVSILSTSAHGEGALFQAYFKPSEVTSMGEDVADTTWAGFLHGLWVDGRGRMREDNGDLRLVYSDDPIINFYFDADVGTRVRRDTDGNGTWDQDNIHLSDLNSMWEAGKKLALRDPDSRNIFSTLATPPLRNSPTTTGLVTGSASSFKDYLRAPTVEEAENIIRFTRGEDLPGSRSRQAYIDTDGDTHTDTLGTWRLGDIIYSTPTVVSRPMENFDQIYGDETFGDFEGIYKGRPTTIYVGANDGMLHAINAGVYEPGDDAGSGDTREHGRYSADYPGYFTSGPFYTGALVGESGIGQEIWAYVPQNLLPHIRWLKDPNYGHVYYVDMKPKVTDARIFSSSSKHPQGWGTVLVCGLRMGGKTYAVDDFNQDGSPGDTRTFTSCFFALDITVPTDPELLWEFTDSQLGFTTCYPAIVRTGDRESGGDWYVVLGSGPTDFDGGSTQEAAIYVLDLKTGEPQSGAAPITLGTNHGFVGGLSSMDLERDFNVNALYVGESYSSGGTWYGKMHRVLLGTEAAGYQSPSGWDSSVLASTRQNQAIVSTPNIAMYKPVGIPWVFWGTGRFFSSVDKAPPMDNATQSFYGVKDEQLAAGVDAEDLSTADLIDATGFEIYYNTPEVTIGGSGLGSIGLSTGDSWDQLKNTMLEENGWFFDINETLGDGERVLESSSVFGGLVLFTAFKPNDDICGFGGNGALYSVNYATGTAAPGKTGYGIFNFNPPAEGTELERNLDLEEGRPSSLSIHIGEEDGGTLYIQGSTGEIKEVEADLENPTGSVVWYER